MLIIKVIKKILIEKTINDIDIFYFIKTKIPAEIVKG